MIGTVLFSLLLFMSSLCSSEALYLTFFGDPSKGMAVHWLEQKSDKRVFTVRYKKEDDQKWQEASSKISAFGEYVLKCCLLKDLDPDTGYVFQLLGESHLYRFRTLPSRLTRPIRIAIGGDACEEEDLYIQMNKSVAKYEPDFVILGGDLAYDGLGEPVERWRSFFKRWQKTMKTQEGYLIPLIATIGNHDMAQEGQLFLKLFPYLSQRSYGKLQIANRAAFFLLDTDAIASVKGRQTAWLETALAKCTMPYKFAVYHRAAYPSVYSMKTASAEDIRNSWPPLFERYGVPVAFEHHNHAFKKTYPLRNGKVDKKGVVYLGDGSWGVLPRPVRDFWYIEKSESINSFSLLTLEKDGFFVEMIDIQGHVFDTLKGK